MWLILDKYDTCLFIMIKGLFGTDIPLLVVDHNTFMIVVISFSWYSISSFIMIHCFLELIFILVAISYQLNLWIICITKPCE